MSKSAFVAVVGRPSAGKSTLVNALCGQKVSIVSPVPQTTRNAIRGIRTEERGQLVFVDTPGYHQSERKFNIKLTKLVKGSLDDCDVVLYLVDSSRPFGDEERELLAMVAKAKAPVLLVLNKVDVSAKASGEAAQARDELFAALAAGLPGAATLEVSALTGDGLDKLKDELFARSPEGHEWYPGEYYTDQEPEFRIAEMIREQVMNRTREEIPHSTYIDIEDLDLRDLEGQLIGPDSDFDPGACWDLPSHQRPRLNIRAFICVERDSQKGIVVGKGGAGIKAIREAAELQIRELFPYFVTLDLRVKVAPKWRSDDRLIERMIH
jgi:GTP-binding protein Era